MAIVFSSTFPLDGTIQVPQTVATTLIDAITFTIQSNDPPINLATVNVLVNGQLVVNNGVSAASDFFPVIISSTSTVSVALTFNNPLDKFDSFETVTISVSASDSSSSFNNSFTFRVEDVVVPLISEVAPSFGSNDNAPNTPIFFRISDSGSGTKQESLIVTVDVEVDAITTSHNAVLLGIIQPGFTGSIQELGTNLDVFLTKTTEYDSDAQVTVNIHAEDEQNSVDGYFQFNILDIQPPTISNLIPAANSVGISGSTTISLTCTDQNGSGIDLSTLNIKINGISAILNGQLQYSFVTLSSQLLITYFPSSTDIESIVVVLVLINELASAIPTVVDARTKDNRRNEVHKNYSFRVRDYLAPQVTNQFPEDGSVDILRTTDIRFKIVEDFDGYGVDFNTLNILVDGYSILNHLLNGIPVDGYRDGYLTRTFEDPVFNVQDYYVTPIVVDAYYDGYYDAYGDAYSVNHPGFTTTIYNLATNEYDFVINPLTSFGFDKDVSVKIELTDRGGNSDSVLYFFHTAKEGQIITTAFPDTGTYKNFIDGYGLVESYKFLYETGVTFSTNIPNTTTYFTTDGSVPRIDSYNRVIKTTQVYTKPILINKQGLNVIKYFSADEAGNKEEVKQEVYMIDILPQNLPSISSILIVADIPFKTTTIPVESVALFKAGQLIRVLDDVRPPSLVKILAISSISNPQFIIVDLPVEKLKVSRSARVELTTQPIDPKQAIEFETREAGYFLYIGSDGQGDKQADAVVEQLRILNTPSTDEEILADFTLLAKGQRFLNQDTRVALSSEFSKLEKERVNLPNSTLVLLNFDGSVDNTSRQGVLTHETTPLVDVLAASNDIIFTIKVKKGEFVDRELLKTVLTNFAPVDLNVIVRFEEIG